MRDEGAVSIAEALKANVGLFRLDLSNTQARGLGAVRIRGLKV